MIAEQGLGDTIQFIRFAPKVKALGATVVFRCPKPLLKLFAKFPGIDVLIPDGEPLPAFDVYVPLMSLPAIFRTSLEDVPGIHPVPYLRADPELVERWRDRLGPARPASFASESSGRETRPTPAIVFARPRSRPSFRSPPYRA